MIESEIIPRLMLAHAPAAASPPAPADVGPRTLDAFARMALSSEAPALTAYVEALIAGGLPLERALVDLLAPTARRLGDEWNEDAISFTDVTVGLSRLQQVVRTLRVDFPIRSPGVDAPAACFMTPPGEQHTFGLSLLEDHFRRAGWRAFIDTPATQADLVQAVACEWFDIFGLSVTCDTPVGTIAATVAAVRGASRNRALLVLVGGRVFDEDPDLAEAVGADAACSTPADALSLAGDALHAAAPS